MDVRIGWIVTLWNFNKCRFELEEIDRVPDTFFGENADQITE